MKSPDQKYCTECGTPMPRAAEMCPACGSAQRAPKKWTPARIAIGCIIAAGSFLVLVFVIGIIAAIAIPKFATTKERAYVAAMRADLRNLVAAEETYRASHGTYQPRVEELSGFVFTLGVELDQPIDADSSGWRATVRHRASPARCSIGVGSKVPNGAREGEPFCTRGPGAATTSGERN